MHIHHGSGPPCPLTTSLALQWPSPRTSPGPPWSAESETEKDAPNAKGSGGKGKGSDEKGKSDKGKSWGVLPGSNAKGSGPGPSAKGSGDSSEGAKGKSKSRRDMTQEEKKVANLNSAKNKEIEDCRKRSTMLQ